MTIPQIIIRAKISQWIAVTAIHKGGVFGGGIPSHLPSLIYQVRKSVERIQDLDPTDDYLLGNANYLYALCGRFGLQASYYINAGGSVAGVTSGVNYGIPTTSYYTAVADGETVLELTKVDGSPLPSGTLIIYAVKGVTPLNPTQYGFAYPNLTLLSGISMSAEEVLSFMYVVPT